MEAEPVVELRKEPVQNSARFQALNGSATTGKGSETRERQRDRRGAKDSET